MYYVAIRFILWQFGIFWDHLLHSHFCIKRNLATLVWTFLSVFMSAPEKLDDGFSRCDLAIDIYRKQ
jgi:hypothetical protein